MHLGNMYRKETMEGKSVQQRAIMEQGLGMLLSIVACSPAAQSPIVSRRDNLVWACATAAWTTLHKGVKK